MDSTQLWTFLLLLTLRRSSSLADPAVTVDCDNPELYRQFLSEGESLRFVFEWANPKNNFTWYWKTSQDVRLVSTEETELVHARGHVLFLLNATQGSSGCFMAREEREKVRNHFLKVSVVPKNSSLRYYSEVVGSPSVIIDCPSRALDTCKALNGSLSWYKDGVLLPEELSARVPKPNARPEDQGLYDCVCTWTYHQHQYRSVGSTQVRLREQEFSLDRVQILTPTEEEQLADEGARLLLNCSVLCGTNVPLHMCKAWWRTTTTDLNSEGYNQTNISRLDDSKNTVATEVLTIARVSAEDLQRQFMCLGSGPFGDPVSFTIRLRPRQSIAPMVAVGSCVFLLCVLVAVMVKYFSIDLALLSRRFIPFRLKDNGVKVFDAYVVYQLQPQDKPTEEAQTRFVSQDLPRVLEEQCGYRLFIHGRDDLPGEDLVELVEERMRKSRRLIVILTPGSGSEVSETFQQPEGYDWQVGLHQALVQRELSVILIQLGDTGPGGYSHLPPALQHLIQRSAPIRWPLEPQAARSNSRLWKRVRYLMPAAPVRRYPLSTI